MKQLLLLSFLVAGLLVASEPGAAGPASGAGASECPICMQPVDLGLPADNPETAVTSTPLFGCNHPGTYFHADCLAGHIQTYGGQTTCPICRNKLLDAINKSNIPGIITAVLPSAPAAPVVARVAEAPVQMPAHIANIDQIAHRYNQGNLTLDLSQTNIRQIDAIVFEQIANRWPHLQALLLNNTPLEELPPQIGNLITLRRLDLADTAISVVPPEIGNLSRLKFLYLSNTGITIIPAEIGRLTNLRVFYIFNTRLASLPVQIGDLIHLESLDLHRTLVENLPVEIGNLSHLEILNLANTPITVLPREIGRLENLQDLNLAGTRITVLPPEIGQLRNLHSLNIGFTQIADLPPEIYNLHNLEQSIHFDETPLEQKQGRFDIERRLEESNPRIRIRASRDLTFEYWQSLAAGHRA